MSDLGHRERVLTPVTGRLGYLLKHSNLRFAELTSLALAPHGIDGREWAVLLTIAEGDPMSQREVARRLSVDRTTMVALIDELEGKGLVRRSPHPEDRRKNVVSLTRVGRTTLAKARRAIGEAERRFLDPLPADEARRFKEALRALVHAAESN